MIRPSDISRRRLLKSGTAGVFCAALNTLLPVPLWAANNRAGISSVTHPGRYDLEIGPTALTIDGEPGDAMGINGTVPGPLLRFKEGESITLNVHNALDEDSSIHWHGLLVPTNMDGVPGLSYPGIKPGETYRYHYDVKQSGTYWYHSHSGLQEQVGVYGPIVIDPRNADPVRYEVEFVVLLSDWTFEDPERIFANLKRMDDYYNYQKRTVFDFFDDVQAHGWKSTIADRRMWGRMRMAPSDIADVTGATYTYLMNGHGPDSNWTGLFAPGERVRLRFINGSAMSFFNVRIPGLEMTVVQADGQNVSPVVIDEFQIGTAETYDVVVTPSDDKAYTIFAEAMDRSGFARGTLTPRAGLTAPVPALRERPLSTMKDMGMDHGSMSRMDHGDKPRMDHRAKPQMDHSRMDHARKPADDHESAQMDHGSTPEMKQGDMQHDEQPMVATHNHRTGPGVANLTEMPGNRLGEPGAGLTAVGHRVLTYADLKALEPNTDDRNHERSLELHLTGSMERYMWSFDGVKYSEVDGPIQVEYGERLRMVLVNDTMMAHPIHLHGMFVELVNDNGSHNPRKHTVVVKPGERLAVDITADAPGLWAFHCHLLYHMKAGMMQAVLVGMKEV
ncbi:MAG: copper resistance system multicopper oxidase [Gammaproteobacteria bacterium]|nr:copper resistance system multicopper oxidase [Gammaproteobacteria bacterium]